MAHPAKPPAAATCNQARSASGMTSDWDTAMTMRSTDVPSATPTMTVTPNDAMKKAKSARRRAPAPAAAIRAAVGGKTRAIRFASHTPAPCAEPLIGLP